MPADRFTRRFLEELRDQGAQESQIAGPEAARALARDVLATNGPGPRMHEVIDRTARTPEGVAVPVRVLTPVPNPLAVVVYFHGGGWVAGSMEASETIARKLAERSSSTFVLVDYRLAPEHTHPAAIEDAYAALLWTAERITKIAGKEVPLVVAGDDVGAALAAATAVRARDEAGPRIDLQVLICPVLDAEAEDVGGPCAPWATHEALRWGWRQYAPGTLGAEHCPGLTEDLTGLPDAVVVLAEISPSRTSAERYARRLEEAGVEVDAQVYEGQVHGFFNLLVLPIGEKAFQQVIKAIRAASSRAVRVHL